MKDEEYVLRQDNRDRAVTARSARNKRTHCGKGGRVKLPSDYMTKKELNAMSGECKSYRLNDPMKWDEFKAMPDDIKITYIKLIREKFGATDRAIAEMMGLNTCSFSQAMNYLGLSNGRHKGRREPWNKEGFLIWANGVPAVQAELPETPVETVEEVVEEVEETPIKEVVCSMPTTGQLTFEGNVDEICNTLKTLLKGADVRMFLKWNLVEVEHG